MEGSRRQLILLQDVLNFGSFRTPDGLVFVGLWGCREGSGAELLWSVTALCLYRGLFRTRLEGDPLQTIRRSLPNPPLCVCVCACLCFLQVYLAEVILYTWLAWTERGVS